MTGQHQQRPPVAAAPTVPAEGPAEGSAEETAAAPRQDGHEALGAAAQTASSGEVAALRRELQRLRWEVESLRERVQHLDGELGFAMLTAGRLRGRLDREVAAREALEALPAGGEARPAVVSLSGQSPSSSRSAACRSGTRSFLTEVDT